jgi:alpha-D-xyloside xylohydrolase
MMRALVMDFAKDKNALDINDQFLFGKSIMVSPVTTAMYVRPAVIGRDTVQVENFSTIKIKETYLPAGTDWYDFWTGEKFPGGNKVTKQTPIDIIPLYIKAGSIIPLGPIVQYAEEKKWDHLEICVYPGANGKFVLYEDENDNYNYEKAVYSTIDFGWDDKKRTLTIHKRKGSFPGMLQERKFSIRIVDTIKIAEENTLRQPGKDITYDGKAVVVKL